MKFTQFIQFRALTAKAGIQGQAFNSAAMEGLIEKAAAIPLFDRLTNTLSILDISKRAFIEAAIILALNEADEIITEVDVFEGRAPVATDEEKTAALSDYLESQE
jgi:hypothetical protein